MKDIYDWVPWSRELAEEILNAGQNGLITRARQVEWPGSDALLLFGDQGIDPFSFIYFLAQKNTRNQRPIVYPSVANVFDLTSQLPDLRNKDLFTFPTPTPNATVLFHNGKEFRPNLLWNLFRQAVDDQPQINATFEKVLEIPSVAMTKLTHTLFLINPEYFVPADSLTHVPAVEDRNLRRWDLDRYLRAIRQAKQTLPGCQTYEINMLLYLQYMSSESPLLTADSRFFQVSTRTHSRDCWQDFDRSYAVYTDVSALGPTGRRGEGTSAGYSRDAPHPLTEPKWGDIILVRTASRGRAIGIVHRNDYATPNGLNDRGRLHVYWINKESARFSAQINDMAFSRTEPNSSTYRAFAKAPPYESTFALIEEAGVLDNRPPQLQPAVHALNLILYGPPGTGKTWHTVTRAVAIVENRPVREVKEQERDDRAAVKHRFDKHRDAGQIELVTFHQNTSYEDFIEGIRPVLTGTTSGAADDPVEPGSVGEVHYELSQGVLRRIAERALKDPGQRYVLIIDEINRGNVARVFGELITLVEDSKRIGEEDEALLTLPGSKTKFGVPNNLHLIGTMNTADRSIALLDTALRRRFVFEEMMPKPSHVDIGTDVDGVNCQKLLTAMNRRIAVLLDREHQIGHTYFLRIDTVEALALTFQTRIIPLLQEYFYDDWAKIRAVLNNNAFLSRLSVPKELVRSDLVDSNRSIYELLPSDDDHWTNREEYRTIYDPTPQETGDPATEV